ncbi:MAG: hypothetical protein NTV34_01440 [Proteobacteria bacterium]|nr:hypothetical protein [Pseudomonadota bacterium]
MRLRSFYFLLSFFISTPIKAGDRAGNGGGTAERNFALSLANLRPYIDLGLADGTRHFSTDELAVLTAIKSSLSNEAALSDILTFRSEAQEPGFFILDGAVRVAKTGSTVGETIFINRDLLYTKRDGHWVAMGIPECVAVLIHEFGHHHGEASHMKLDLIAAKIQTLLERRMTQDRFDAVLTVAGDNLPNLAVSPTLTSVDFSTDTERVFNSRLYISDSVGTYDVTGNIMTAIQNVGDQEGAGAHRLAGTSCWGGEFQKSEKSGWRFQQFHLASPRWSYSTTIKPNVFLFAIKAAISIECVSQLGQRMVDPGLEVLYFVILENDGGKTKFKFLDAPELQKGMALVSDDETYKFAAILRGVFDAIFSH